MPHTRSIHQRKPLRLPAGTAVIAGWCLAMCSCIPVTQPEPQIPGKPGLQFSGMAPVADQFNEFHEAVHLTWSPPDSSGAPIKWYTLLRKIPPDSIFDVFTESQRIPADINGFYDDLSGYTFPAGGLDSIYYRICAVDSFARSGDSSEIITVILAPQATLTAFDSANGCLQWDSWIRGGVFSWCSVWPENGDTSFSSARDQKFPLTDEPARFRACFPAISTGAGRGRWHFALYVKANEAVSLNVGFIDVR